MASSFPNLKPKEAIVWLVIDEYTDRLFDKYQVFEPKEILRFKDDYFRKALDVKPGTKPDKKVRQVIRDLAATGILLRKLDTGKFQVVRPK